MKNKIILGTVAIIVLGGLVFVYFSRPVAAPSINIENATEKLSVASDESEAKNNLFQINSAESKIEFRINEVLSGAPFTPVGITNQIAGEIHFDVANPLNIKIGIIKVNARTFKTDSAQRDGVISRLILKSENPANEFIEFKPTSVKLISGEPNGKEFQFNVTGNLTVSGITHEEIFKVKMDYDENGIKGTAETTLKRSDYKLIIPNIPFVANVDDVFLVKADIVAKK